MTPVKRMREKEIIYLEPEKEIVYIPVLVKEEKKLPEPDPVIDITQGEEAPPEVPEEVQEAEIVDDVILGSAAFAEVETKYESADKQMLINMATDLFSWQDEERNVSENFMTFVPSSFKGYNDYRHAGTSFCWSINQ